MREDPKKPVTDEVRSMLRRSWAEITAPHKDTAEVSLTAADLGRLLQRLGGLEPRVAQGQVSCKDVRSPDFMPAAGRPGAGGGWNGGWRSAKCRARMCTHPTSCWLRAAWRLSSWWWRTRPRPSLTKKKETMRFSEMRPAPDELWLLDDRGLYCAEFRTFCAGKIGRLLRPCRKPAAWQAQQDKE